MRAENVQRYIDFFEGLTPASLASLDGVFSDDARFADPFNDVCGTAGIRRVFEHMFAHCERPAFEVDEAVGDGDAVYLRWSFTFGPETARRSVQGVSRVQFSAQGQVVEHVDYWDPAGQLYENIPIIGRLFRALRRRLSATGGRRVQLHQTTAATER